MHIIFTTCTYNHLGRAFSLAESVAQHCRDTKLVIGLIDGAPGDFSNTDLIEILHAGALHLPFLNEMCIKYDTLELNSALKPFFAEHILKTNPGCDKVLYLDSDILLFNDLVAEAEEILISYSIILSPHALSSADEESNATDRNFLRSGIYNAGFFAVKGDEAGFAFLKWWQGKLINHCFIDARKGMFAEQLWLNLVPLYLERVFVSRNLGYNVAYWNLHERTISATEFGYIVNDTYPLMFYHFSGAAIDCFEKNSLSLHQTKYTFTNRPDVIPLFELYVNGLKKHDFEKFNAYTTVSSKFKTRSKSITRLAEVYKKVAKRWFFRQ